MWGHPSIIFEAIAAHRPVVKETESLEARLAYWLANNPTENNIFTYGGIERASLEWRGPFKKHPYKLVVRDRSEDFKAALIKVTNTSSGDQLPEKLSQEKLDSVIAEAKRCRIACILDRIGELLPQKETGDISLSSQSTVVAPSALSVPSGEIAQLEEIPLLDNPRAPSSSSSTSFIDSHDGKANELASDSAEDLNKTANNLCTLLKAQLSAQSKTRLSGFHVTDYNERLFGIAKATKRYITFVTRLRAKIDQREEGKRQITPREQRQLLSEYHIYRQATVSHFESPGAERVMGVIADSIRTISIAGLILCVGSLFTALGLAGGTTEVATLLIENTCYAGASVAALTIMSNTLERMGAALYKLIVGEDFLGRTAEEREKEAKEHSGAQSGDNLEEEDSPDEQAPLVSSEKCEQRISESLEAIGHDSLRLFHIEPPKRSAFGRWVNRYSHPNPISMEGIPQNRR